VGRAVEFDCFLSPEDRFVLPEAKGLGLGSAGGPRLQGSAHGLGPAGGAGRKLREGAGVKGQRVGPSGSADPRAEVARRAATWGQGGGSPAAGACSMTVSNLVELGSGPDVGMSSKLAIGRDFFVAGTRPQELESGAPPKSSSVAGAVRFRRGRSVELVGRVLSENEMFVQTRKNKTHRRWRPPTPVGGGLSRACRRERSRTRRSQEFRLPGVQGAQDATGDRGDRLRASTQAVGGAGGRTPEAGGEAAGRAPVGGTWPCGASIVDSAQARRAPGCVVGRGSGILSAGSFDRSGGAW